jgi:L-asparaginase
MERNTVRKLYILTTGGTIEKTYDESEGTLHNRETVIKQRITRKLRLPYLNIEVKSIMNKDSLEMDKQDRKIISDAILRFSNYGEPIVVLHGTDTMQQTVELCVERLAGLRVPVVFTGAMKPLGFEDSDAIQNVTEAMLAAQILQPGIYISFHNRLFNVPGVRKNRQKLTFESF